MKIGRNDICHCGSGKKFKKCCLGKENTQDEFILSMKKAGKFNGQLMDYIRSNVKIGIVTQDLDLLAADFIEQHGHKSATLDYEGFPKSICVSVNEVVCHGIASELVLQANDLVKIDVSTIVDGHYADSCETVVLDGLDNHDAVRLSEITAKALQLGIQSVKPGLHYRCIAEAIEPYVNSCGCSVVRDFTGHGIGVKFHQDFSVFHHMDAKFPDIILKPGMTFTIEPMINLGSYEVWIDPVDKWTVRTKDGLLSAQFEHTLLVTENGYEILTLTPRQKE